MSDKPNVLAEGGGRVSVDVQDIISSPKVQKQVEAVRQLAAAPDQGETPFLSDDCILPNGHHAQCLLITGDGPCDCRFAERTSCQEQLDAAIDEVSKMPAKSPEEETKLERMIYTLRHHLDLTGAFSQRVAATLESMRDECAKLRERVGELESAHASLCDTVASAKRNSGLPDTGIELGCDLREHIWQISYAEVKQRQRTSEAESRLSALAKGAGELPEETGTIKTAREAGDMAPPAVQRMLKAYDELRSIAARALEDSKRLDWLDTLPKRRFKDHNGKEWPIISEIYINSHGHHVWLRNETADIVQAGEGKTIREAIDAALNSGGGEEK